MDATSFRSAFRVIYGGISSRRYYQDLPSLIQLVHALVLHNRILIEPSAYEGHMEVEMVLILEDSAISLNGLVESIWIGRADLFELESLAEQRAIGMTLNPSTTVVVDLLKNRIYENINLGYASHIIDHKMVQSMRNHSLPKTGNLLERIIQKHIQAGEEKVNSDDMLVEFTAYRTYLYLAISCFRGLPYLPHPHRVPLIQHELQASHVYKQFADASINTIEQTSLDVISQRNKIFGSNIFVLQFPVIMNYILSRVKKSWKEVIPLTLELRESSDAVAFRRVCTEIDKATREGNTQLLAEALDELSIRSKIWTKELDQPSIDIEIAYPWSVAFNPISLWNYIGAKRRRHLIFLDKLYEASTRSPQLWDKVMKLETR